MYVLGSKAKHVPSHLFQTTSVYVFPARIAKTGIGHLIAHIDVSVLGQQQGHEVHAALLCRQVNWTDALPRHHVGVCAVLQQCGPDVHLVLFGSDVERRVAVLGQEREIKILI